MKKASIVIIYVLMIFSLTACSKEKKENKSNDSIVLTCKAERPGSTESFEFNYNKMGTKVRKIIYKIITKVDLETQDIVEVAMNTERTLCRDSDGNMVSNCDVTVEEDEVIVTVKVDLENLGDDLPFTLKTPIEEMEEKLNSVAGENYSYVCTSKKK